MRPPRSTEARPSRPACTVIVPTRNSERTLSAVLEGAFSQTVPTEVVVVDNFSRDRTLEIARSLGARIISAGDERSRQRNVGAGGARTPWLFFLDADMVPTADTVASCLRAADDSSADAIVVPQHAVGEGFLAKARAFEKACYEGDEQLEAPRFFRRDFFESIGGYDEDLIAAEDWDISARSRAAGAVIARSDSPIVHLDGRIRLGELFTKMEYYSESLLRYRTKHPQDAAKQMSIARAAWWGKRSMVLAHPLLFVGVMILKVTEAAGFLSGVIKARWGTGKHHRGIREGGGSGREQVAR
jgi:glycosyltransferase involved in cell wall biosynthesis